MSTKIPLRITQSHAHPMRRQCLFQHRTLPSTPRCIAAPSARAFSSTPAQLRQKENRLVDTRLQLAGASANIANSPSPSAQSDQRGADEMADDIGLLQNTVIRAPFSKLPRPTSWEFYSYFWTLLKARFTALYTRSHFKRCAHKKGIMSYLPVDFMNQKALKEQAKHLYTSYYSLLAAGEATQLRDICLLPLAVSLRTQIAARGPVKLNWTLLKFKSARIVSHRCSPLGGDHPDTSYRQCIVRIESEQQLIVGSEGKARDGTKTRAPKWAPSNAPKKADAVRARTGIAEEGLQSKGDRRVQTVVEFLVMQTRVLDGQEEGWKVWGFASESTPAKIEEDEEYWRRMLDAQTAA